MAHLAKLKYLDDQKKKYMESRKSDRFSIKNILVYYLKNCTIHGLKYISENEHWFTRAFWIIALVLSVGMCGYLLHTSYAKWQYKPDIGLTRKIRPAQEIPFPSITICPQTKVSKTLTNFEQTYRRYFEDDEVHGESWIDSEYFEYLLHVCDPQLLNNFKFNSSLLPDDDSLMAHLEEILYTLDDSMMFCKWREGYVDCSEIFTEVLTDQGNCFSFNNLHPVELFDADVDSDFYMFEHTKTIGQWTLEEGYITDNLKAYPWSIISHQYDGLRVVLINTDTDSDFVCQGSNQGFKFSWNMPGEISNTLNHFLLIPIEEDISISMKPLLAAASENLLKYPPKLRQCFTQQERQLRYYKMYSKHNCLSECLSNYTLKTCECVKFSMPRDNATQVCNATKLKCILEAERSWLSLGDGTIEDAAHCNCMPACVEITYEPQLFQADFDFERMFRSYGFDISDMPGVQMSRFTIYFENADFEVIERYAVFDFMDFVASCGGLLGLFMGFSILSFLELAYYVILWIIMLRKSRKVEPVGLILVKPKNKY